jgi:hypothetical protein
MRSRDQERSRPPAATMATERWAGNGRDGKSSVSRVSETRLGF